MEMKLVWFLLHIMGALCWFMLAAGLGAASPWVATVAFVLLGFQAIIWAMKELVKAE